MNIQEIKERIKGIISNSLEIEIDSIHSWASFVLDLGIDSLEMVGFIMALEKEFNMEIGDDDIEKFTTVDELVNYVTGRIKEDVF